MDTEIGWTAAIWFASLLVLIAVFIFIIYIMFDIKIDKQIKQCRLLEVDEEFKLSDVFSLLKNRSFIFITILCLTFYSAVFPFMKYASDFFYTKFQVSLETSGDISSYVYVGAIIFTPLFGWFVDKKGFSATMMIFGSIMILVVHMLFALTNITPYIPIVLLGIAFSLVPAAMWPAVAKIVPESKIGTAYGIMFSVQNLGLWGFPILAGNIVTNTNKIMINEIESKDYTYTILMFATLGIVGLIFSFLLKNEDKKSGYGLDLPSNVTK
jgi:predicted MFS family arabinose efflux permease